MDTLYAGARSPLYDELRRMIHDYYRITYGPDSDQFAASRPGHPKTYYEAHVAERLIGEMIGHEPSITLVKGFYPVRAARDGATIRDVVFREKHGDRTFVATGQIFADCSYEADLAVVAGVRYRVGREARSEFGEEHAGKIFLRRVNPWPPPHVDPAVIAKYKELNLFHYNRWFEILRPYSSGEADSVIQAFNIRAILTTDPANRFIPEKPPANYNPAALQEIWSKKPQYSQLLGPLPNQKYLWNMPELIGPQNEYPDGSWKVREDVIEQHREATAGMLYFLQNDPSVATDERAQWRNLGFARDEFGDSGNLPSEVYARETRRIRGRTIFTENDVRLATDLQRSPVHRDSISVAEWFLDVHSCGSEQVEGSLHEGEIYLNYVSYPGQISYRTILPEDLDNLLVPVCVSTSHIGWGAIRLEPTWMSLGESAAHAAVLAVETGLDPARIDCDQLVRRLANRRIMVSFFNDVALDAGEPWVPAIQYLGTQGFFGSYNANPFGSVTAPMAAAWAEAAAQWMRGAPVNATALACRMIVAEKAEGNPLTVEEFLDVLSREMTKASVPHSLKELQSEMRLGSNLQISRGNACRIIFAFGSRNEDARA
jgi:hypothetical protein